VPGHCGIAQSLTVTQHSSGCGTIEPEAVNLLFVRRLSNARPEDQNAFVVDRLRDHATPACQKRPHPLRLQDVICTFKASAQPRVQRSVQRTGNFARWAGGDRPLEKRSQQVRHHRKAQCIVQEIKQRSEAWHLREVDFERVATARFGRERRFS
jgi:hypothetical protein